MAKKRSKTFSSEQGELLKALYGNKKLVQPVGGEDSQADLFAETPEPQLDTLPSGDESIESQAKSVKDILKNKVTAERVANGFVGALMKRKPELTEDQAKKEIKDALMHTVETGEFVDIFGTGMTPAAFLEEVKGLEYNDTQKMSQESLDIANYHMEKMRGILDEDDPKPSSNRGRKLR